MDFLAGGKFGSYSSASVLGLVCWDFDFVCRVSSFIIQIRSVTQLPYEGIWML